MRILYTTALNFGITLGNPGQGQWAILEQRVKWKCNKKSGVTVVHGSVATSPLPLGSHLLRVKVITRLQSPKLCFPQLREHGHGLSAFLCLSGLQVDCWCHQGTTHPSPPLLLMNIGQQQDRSIPLFYLRYHSQERTKILCLTKSVDPTPG